MPKIRVAKNKDYTVMSNYHFRERKMSLKAKGLLSLMLSLPDDWDYSVSGLVSICAENETAITTALQELKRFGYLEVKKLMPGDTASGRIEYEYIIREKPKATTKRKTTEPTKQESEKQELEDQVLENQELEKQDLEKQGVEILGLEILALENQGQLNTNKQNTKELNTNNKNTNNRFRPPAIDDIICYCEERKNNVDPYRFFDYYESNGWMVGKNKMRDWRAAVRTWERNAKPDTGGRQVNQDRPRADYSELFQ